MPDVLPATVVVRRDGVAVILDLTVDGLPSVLHWGPDPGPLDDDDLQGLRAATARQTAPGTLDAPGMYNMTSNHPGGANVLMCDGSVKFLKNSLSQPVVWALGSRANGEVISADAY